MIYDTCIHADPFFGFDVSFLLNGLEIFMDKYKRVVNILYPYLACEKNIKYNLL